MSSMMSVISKTPMWQQAMNRRNPSNEPSNESQIAIDGTDSKKKKKAGLSGRSDSLVSGVQNALKKRLGE